MDDYNLEIILRFINASKRETPKQKYLQEKLKQIPYDMAFLNPKLEQYFLEEQCLILPYQLFLTEKWFKKRFNKEMLQKTIWNYTLDITKDQIQELKEQMLINKRKARKIAYIRGIYILSLLEILDEERKNIFLSEFCDEIEGIPYDFAFIRSLKKEAREASLKQKEEKQE